MPDLIEILIEESEVKAIRVALGEYKGKRHLMVSHMWRKRNSGNDEWQWSRKNVTLKLKSIKELVKFLDTRMSEIEEFLPAESVDKR